MRNLSENQNLFQILLIKQSGDMVFFSLNKIYFHKPQFSIFKKYLGGMVLAFYTVILLFLINILGVFGSDLRGSPPYV